jgi:hypothetical protein
MFDHDNRDDPIVHEHGPITIRITCAGTGEEIQRIEIPAVRKRRSEVNPAWLAMHDAEQSAGAQEENSQ